MATGSLHNRIMGRTGPVPEVGMAATILMWSDRKAATIVSIKGKSVTVREDLMKRVDNNGMSDSQAWEVVEEAVGAERVFTLRKNGAWVAKGMGMRDGTRLAIGRRSHYHDFSF